MSDTPRQEIPVDYEDNWWAWGSGGEVTTAIQALMEAPPYEEPVESAEEKQPLREAVADCIERLSPEHRYVIDALNSERLSVRQLAPRLGLQKSRTHDIYKNALNELRDIMLRHPVIRERLGL